MTIQLARRVTEQNPKNRYRINVQTMTNDADGWNDFDLDFASKAEFIEVVRYCKVMELQYTKCGRGGGSGFYDHLPFFDKWFNEDWYYEYGDYMDSWEGFTLSYFDMAGEEFEVNYSLSEEDIAIIKSFEVKQ